MQWCFDDREKWVYMMAARGIERGSKWHVAAWLFRRGKLGRHFNNNARIRSTFDLLLQLRSNNWPLTVT